MQTILWQSGKRAIRQAPSHKNQVSSTWRCSGRARRPTQKQWATSQTRLSDRLSRRRKSKVNLITTHITTWAPNKSPLRAFINIHQDIKTSVRWSKAVWRHTLMQWLRRKFSTNFNKCSIKANNHQDLTKQTWGRQKLKTRTNWPIYLRNKLTP